MAKVKIFEHQGRFAVIRKYRTHIIFYAILGGITCGYTFLFFPFDRMKLLFLAGLISILYTLPIFGKSMRLRDFSFIKIFLIALVWALVTESIPLYEKGFSSDLLLLLFIERVCFFIAITIPFDIRDIQVDMTNKVKTIPTALGKSKATYLAIVLLVICILIEIYLFQGTTVNGNASAIITYVSTAILVLWVKNKKDDYYFSGLMDGTIMLPWLFIQVIN